MPMRIGIACYPTLGGSGIFATELGQALAARGHEIHFITYEIPFRLHLDHPLISFHEVELFQYDLLRYPDYALALAVKMAEVAKESALDLLHVHYAVPHATSAYLAKQLLKNHRPAVITTLHGTDITLVGRDPSYFEIVKFSIEQSDGITAVSQALKEETQASFSIQHDIRVIYNFTIPKPELLRARREKKTDAEKWIVHASNFRPLKRTEEVVRIFAGVRSQLPVKLLFLGSGPSMDETRRLVHELKLEKEVLFVGKREEIDQCMIHADLFLLPSSQESFGLAALEAMSYGIPVVASAVGGLPELIENNSSGFLLPVYDHQGMVQACVRLLTDPQLAQNMGKRAQERAQQHFNVDQIIPQYEAYYREVLAGAPTA